MNEIKIKHISILYSNCKVSLTIVVHKDSLPVLLQVMIGNSVNINISNTTGYFDYVELSCLIKDKDIFLMAGQDRQDVCLFINTHKLSLVYE